MDLEIEKEAVFPPSVHYQFQPFYHSCLLQSKITTMATQTDIGARPTTTYKRWTGYHELRPQDTDDKPHPSANYFDLTKDTTNTGIRQVREFSAISVPLKQRNQNEIQESRMQHGIACYSMFHSISHKTAFLRTS